MMTFVYVGLLVQDGIQARMKTMSQTKTMSRMTIITIVFVCAIPLILMQELAVVTI